jgi:hypothetical protein
MKIRVLVALTAFLSATVALGQSPHAPTPSPAPVSPAAAAWVQKNLVGWPKMSIAVAADLITAYGLPKDSNARELTWYDNGPWKRTVLHKEEIQHNFPYPHKDVLEQTVNYRVPADKVADLVKYDGSLVVDRTRGELTVHCQNEQANTLTLNIADDIVKGDRSVEQALAYHAQVIRGVQIGEPETYPYKLRFKAPQPSADSADPGEEAPLLKHLNASAYNGSSRRGPVPGEL